MAKRMLLHFQKGSFPAYEKVDENGYPQPCALGIPWVNEDTQRTLARLHIPKTDPWGDPLPEEPVAEDPRAGIQADPPAGGRGADRGRSEGAGSSRPLILYRQRSS